MSLPIACASSSIVIFCLISTSPFDSGIFFFFFFVSYMELDTYIGTHSWHKLRNNKNNIKEKWSQAIGCKHIFFTAMLVNYNK